MANLYFPGCKVKGDFPAASEKLAAYIQSKRVVTPGAAAGWTTTS